MQPYQKHKVLNFFFCSLDDKNEMVETNRRRNDGNDDLNRMDSAMVLDEQASSINDNSTTNNSDNNGYTGSNGNNQRDNLNHRNIDNYGLLGSVNTNLLSFIQKLRDPMSKMSS